MYLTKEEERILEGEKGWAYQTAMKVLVKLGDLFGATRLIPVKSAHISGVSYKTIGDAATEFLEEIVKAGGVVQVKSTINPAGFDPEHLKEMPIPEEYRAKQTRILNLYKRMKIEPALTCTPYYIQRPEAGSHLAWAESSAVVYANSVLKAWTNREGGPSALASALIGKTPNYGMHRAENRQAEVLVRVEPELKGETEYGALGIYVGKILGGKVPNFIGLRGPTESELKHLGAALASTGMTPIFHHGAGHEEGLEEVTVEEADLKGVVEELSTASGEPDMVFIGCPHCSLGEIERIARLMRGRKLKDDIKLWVCTSRYVRDKARVHVKVIEAAGGHVICDTCAVVTWLREIGVERLMTNSAKTAYYAPVLNKVGVALAPTSKCIDAACKP
ncbi:MAG: hypothetical protein AYL31_003380 [Candidatus Bathyarchaeota archaeon B26-1]|nr:MAG: hypothetical protein AYL31_003380 [Candidatus Bathyarchaeota archaeon B26-1]